MTDNRHSWIKRGLTAGLFYLLSIAPRLIGRPKRMPGKFYAHRGLHDLSLGIPENTMAAFRRAVEHGYGIELDVQLTKDGQVVAAHDFDLKRICGVEKDVDELTYEELKALPVLGTAEHIPLFQDVLDLVDGKVPLLVEIKYKHVGSSICRKAAELLDHYSGSYCIESFHPVALMWFRKYRPYTVRGQLGMNFHKDDGTGAPCLLFPAASADQLSDKAGLHRLRPPRKKRPFPDDLPGGFWHSMFRLDSKIPAGILCLRACF